MRVAIIAPPDNPVPPLDGCGGIERGVHDLATGLADAGHEVTVLASGDSHIDYSGVRLVPTIGRSCWGDRALQGAAYNTAVDEALRSTAGAITALVSQGDIDVVNLRWERQELVDCLGLLAVPLIVSFSCSPNKHTQAIVDGIDSNNPRVRYTAHTEAHREALAHPAIEVVPYGINPSGAIITPRALTAAQEQPTLPVLSTLLRQMQDYLVLVGRISPKKGQRTAIEISQEAGMPLVLAGEVTNSHGDYYGRCIKPRIDDKTVFYFGRANEEQKYQLVRFAYATLVCSGYETPFVEAYGRVIAESAVSGTPVVGYRLAGSFAEINIPGVTGFDFLTVGEAAQQVRRVGDIDRLRCALAARDVMSTRRFIGGIARIAYELLDPLHNLDLSQQAKPTTA